MRTVPKLAGTTPGHDQSSMETSTPAIKRRQMLAGGLAAVGTLAFGRAGAETASVPAANTASTGALKLYHIHTGESLDIAYRYGGAIVTSALGEIDHFLRDFRTGQVESIDVDLLDILSALYDTFDRRGRFEVISGYRSPKTNAALRQVTNGVAKKSWHMQGRAIDVRLVGTRTDLVRDAAITLGRGGVGYYPDSNFVHVDTGRVRRW